MELNGKVHREIVEVLWPKIDVLDFGMVVDGETMRNTLEIWCQGFVFSEVVEWGLLQRKNGPCGVLAGVQGVFVREMVFEGGVSVEEEWGMREMQEGLVRSLRIALCGCAVGNRVSVVSLNSDYGIFEDTLGDYVFMIKEAILNVIMSQGAVAEGEMFSLFRVDEFHVEDSNEKLDEFIMEKLWMYQTDLGLILFLYSMILSRTVEVIKMDMRLEETKKAFLNPHGDDTLIAGIYGFCTSAIINLIIQGVATFDTLENQTISSKIGFLTIDEEMALETGHRITGDHLSKPELPIWILHGGSHYTVLFAQDKIPYAFDNDEIDEVNLFHYNGLYPGGPKLSNITITRKTTKASIESKNADDYVSFQIISRRKNEVKDIYEFQVAYARGTKSENEIANEDVDLSLIDQEESDPIPDPSQDFLLNNFPLDPTEKWRCLNCTLQTPPNWMAYNDPYTTICKECNKDIEICQYCPWITFDTLPRIHQEWVLERYAPSIQKILRQLWGDSLYQYTPENISI